LDRIRALSVRISSERITARGALGELLLLALALGAYYGVRLLVRDSGMEPLENAAALLRLESVLHLDWEMALQRAFLGHLPLVVNLLNFVYAWGYWLMLAASLGYLYLRRRDVYRALRNAMIISGIVGFFIFANFPAAPPRLASVGILDTALLSSSVLEEVTRPSALTNQNAAMPSFHFGWVLLCGVCLSMTLKGRVSKILVLALPVVMGLTIIVTGNHYVVDAVAGGAVCLLALVPCTLQRRRSEREPPELQKI
jgi:membrane-associated phospholipid phosphatase